MGTKREGISRRQFIGAAAGVSSAALLGSYAGLSSRSATGATTNELSNERFDFRGKHQAGVTTPSQASAIVAAFDITVQGRDELLSIFKTLTNEIEPLTQSEEIRERNSAFAPHDNLINGTNPPADGLTVTVSVGSSLFDGRYDLENRKPKQLEKMPHFPNDNINPTRSHGDLLVQICAHHAETCHRALRIIMRATRSGLVLKWLEQGFIQPNKLGHGKSSTRNLLGFKDGTANINAKVEDLMDELVWVQGTDDEPDWTIGGTYVVARSIRSFVEHWDRTSLTEQEQIIGRRKSAGEPIGSKNEDDTPIFHKNPHGRQIKMDAHIRLANPRESSTEKNRILRRGYNYSRGFDAAGHLDQGLLFICFQKSLRDGFLTVQERLNGEPLEEYIEPNGGGFYFTLPGVEPGSYLGSQMFS